MTFKATLLILLIFSTSNCLKIVAHEKQTHLQPEEKETITVKFKKSDIQDVNSCDPKDDQCQVQICPDTNIMKASYSCYSVIKEELDAWMKKTSKQNKENSNNFKVELSCWKVDEETDDGGDGIGARPEGGFQNLMYLCDINGQKPLHYHYA